MRFTYFHACPSIAPSLSIMSVRLLPRDGNGQSRANATFTAPQPTPSNESKDLSAGPVAGIAIGTGLALAFIAAFLTWFFMRRRERHSQRHHRGEKPNNGYLASGSMRESPNDPGTKGPIATQKDVTSMPLRGLETHLPPPADDGAVSHNISTLFEQIGMHVESFYHKSFVPIPTGAEKRLSEYNSPHLPGPLTELFPQARTGISIIKHCLTKTILDSTTPGGNIDKSFLPLDLAALPSLLEVQNSAKQRKPGKPQIYILQLSRPANMLPSLRGSSLALACFDFVPPSGTLHGRHVHLRPRLSHHERRTILQRCL